MVQVCRYAGLSVGYATEFLCPLLHVLFCAYWKTHGQPVVMVSGVVVLIGHRIEWLTLRCLLSSVVSTVYYILRKMSIGFQHFFIFIIICQADIKNRGLIRGLYGKHRMFTL